MPYRHAWIFLLALVPLTALAFWPNYFSVLGVSPLAYHVHGITASLWLLMLIAQSWSIHHGGADLHRTFGKVSFLIFPAFMVGGVLVLQEMARGYAGGRDPFIVMHGARLGTFDALAGATFAFFYFMALYHRRKVQLHARYMLATVFLLINPVIGRLMPGFVPGLIIREPADFPLFVETMHYANLIAATIALLLFAQAPRYGAPFLIAAIVIGLQSAAFQWIGPQAWWDAVFVFIGGLPSASLAGAALLIGAGIIWLGWTLPRTRPRLAAAE